MVETAYRRWRVPVALFTAILTLYLAFPTRDLYWDGAGFALALDHPALFGTIEANHPLYIGFGRVAHSLALNVAPAVSGLTLLQALNSLLGALSVVVVYLTAAELFADELDAALLAAIFAFSATWWKFATDANAYIPSVLPLLIAGRWLLPGRGPRPMAVALAHTCAMLFHELAVMFVVAAAVGIYAQSRGDRRLAWRNVGAYLAAASILTSSAYYVCFHLATGRTGAGGFWRWITWHTPDSSFSFSLAHNAWQTVQGTVRLALGGRVAAFHSGPVGLGALLALLAVGTALLLRAGSGREPQSREIRQAGAFLWSWVAAYVAFLFFWLPRNTFYRLFYLPPLALLAGARVRRWGGRRSMYAAAALLGTWNYLFYIHPNSLVETNAVARAAVAMHSIWKPGTWVYQGSFNADNWTVFAFNPRVMFKDIDGTRLAETAAELKGFEEGGHETWIDQSGMDLLASDQRGAEWLREHTRPGFKRGFSDGKHRVGFDRLFP